MVYRHANLKTYSECRTRLQGSLHERGNLSIFLQYCINKHWLQVKDRIDFKLLLTTFKALHGHAPIYISENLKPYRPSRSLRPISRNLLTVASSNTSTYGDRVFSFAAAKLWNSLPDHIRCIDTLISFKSSLKTFLFRQAKTPPR